MSTITSHVSAQRSALTAAPQPTRNLQPAAPKSVTTGGFNGASVALSGKSLVLSRLFHGVETQSESVSTRGNANANVHSFLTPQDRDLLAKAYEFAGANEIDPSNVDKLAFDLAVFRRTGPGGPADSTGHLFDLQGQPIINRLTPQDAATAQGILSSNAVLGTEIDRDFLNAVTNPAKTPIHSVDFEFLHRIVSAFSTSEDKESNIDLQRPDIYSSTGFAATTDAATSEEKSLSGARSVIAKRLFESDESATRDSARIDGKQRNPRLLDYLTRTDRETLEQLYAVVHTKAEDLSKIDGIALSVADHRLRAGAAEFLSSSRTTQPQMLGQLLKSLQSQVGREGGIFE